MAVEGARAGDRIPVQQRVLGASADWPRTKFTMDPDMSRAVREAFVRLYEEGLMYRATRLINWCPECQTALSDLEVENEEGANGELFEFAYEVEGGGEIVVATTRPETMLGDTAVAVHPDDPRYTHLHGKRVVPPVRRPQDPHHHRRRAGRPEVRHRRGEGDAGARLQRLRDRQAPRARGDQHPQPRRHDERRRPAASQGMDRKVARKAVKQALDEKGLARGSKPHTLTLPKCQRSGGVVEPMISTQWFLKMQPMADSGARGGAHGQDRDRPRGVDEDVRPLAREHPGLVRLAPALVGSPDPGLALPGRAASWSRASSPTRVRRPGVDAGPGRARHVVLELALWPFSTLGWPERPPRSQKFYPASDLETGYDILFFWVARMMMMGIHFMGEAPFRRVLLHGLVVDETGDKMSKVKGNVIDPLDLIHGATFDEMMTSLPGAPRREALAKFKKAYPSAAPMGNGLPGVRRRRAALHAGDVPAEQQAHRARAEAHRGQPQLPATRIWNATRFALELLGDRCAGRSSGTRARDPRLLQPLDPLALRRRVRGGARRASTSSASTRRRSRPTASSGTSSATGTSSSTKPILRRSPTAPSSRPDAGAPRRATTLAYVLEGRCACCTRSCRSSPRSSGSACRRPASRKATVALAPYPTARPRGRARDAGGRGWMETLQAVITAARTVRSEHERRQEGRRPACACASDSEELLAFLREHARRIRLLVKTAGDPRLRGRRRPARAGDDGERRAGEPGPIEVLVGLKGLVTPKEERARSSAR